MSENQTWDEFPLAELAEINPRRPRGLTESESDLLVTFVPMQAVNQMIGTIDRAETRTFGEVKQGFTYFEEDDVLFAKITPCMQNGKSAVAKGLRNGLGFGSTEFHVIRPDKAKVLPEWILYFVRQDSFRREGTRHFKGAVGQQRVPVEYLLQARIPCPPLAEQKRVIEKITVCLAKVAEVERLRAGSQKDSTSLRSAIFADYVEARVVENDVDHVLGDVVLDCDYGTSKKANTNGVGVPILRMGNIQDGRLETADLKHIDLPANELQKYRLQPGDILINRTNSLELVGKSAVFGDLEGDWVYASYLVRIRVDATRAIPDYVNAVINSRIGRNYVYRTARRAIGMVNINAKEMRRMPLPLPRLEEQQALVARMKDAEPLIQDILADFCREDTDRLTESILRKAFRGEL